MPEAPEVQTVLDYLHHELEHVQIESAEIFHPKLCANLEPALFEKELQGQRFEKFERIGKYLIFEMSSVDWICHLRMEGKFLLLKQLPLEEKERKHIHAVFALSDGRLLCYRDTRKFGRMYLYPKTENIAGLPVFRKVGKDALDPSADWRWMQKKAGKRCLPIKSFLLDQSCIAGIGNIYADEILFACRIAPSTPSCTLDENQWKEILLQTRRILQAAIAQKGTTIRTFSSGNHQPGTFQNFLQVHQKAGMPCPVCGSLIRKKTVGQRGTYYCPHCQPGEPDEETDEIGKAVKKGRRTRRTEYEQDE